MMRLFSLGLITGLDSHPFVVTELALRLLLLL